MPAHGMATVRECVLACWRVGVLVLGAVRIQLRPLVDSTRRMGRRLRREHVPVRLDVLYDGADIWEWESTNELYLKGRIVCATTSRELDP